MKILILLFLTLGLTSCGDDDESTSTTQVKNPQIHVCNETASTSSMNWMKLDGELIAASLNAGDGSTPGTVASGSNLEVTTDVSSNGSANGSAVYFALETDKKYTFAINTDGSDNGTIKLYERSDDFANSACPPIPAHGTLVATENF